MCGRFAMDKETDDMIQEFVAEGGDFRDWRPSWNIAPTDPIPVFLQSKKRDEPAVRRVEVARWSLTPSWSKELKTRVPTFNARAETAAEKPMFKASVASRRAIVPAIGYYEWQTNTDTGKKTPFFIHARDGELLGLAGLYAWWADPALGRDDPARWHLTATILTSDAVQTLEDIHDRNPVPLPRELWDHWVDPTVVGDQALLDEAVRAAIPVANDLVFDRVGPVVGDGPELIRPLEHEAD
ncbi:SOS response-associated peptidase [Leifsonia poae]|uniref:SOS response-associated peptidase n=1 Tax=Leifsonia poae TaxID=110933 RepID=UPI001CC0A280|nr:SOS response-associated peptidase [Leifsonia poae]